VGTVLVGGVLVGVLVAHARHCRAGLR
jgi:hypothetical protein